MRVLIVEDEPRAANRLARLILELLPDACILAKTTSVAGTLDWLERNEPPNLIFMDVRLEDGDSFEILRKRKIDTPIIFCTAYSDYALQAFGVHSIDYLLKPVIRSDLSRALSKYLRFSGFRMSSADWPEFPVEGPVGANLPAYRRQFLVALAGQFTPVKTRDLIAAKSYLKGTQLIDRDGRHWVLDHSLGEVENALDPGEFVRVSRQWLVRATSIQSLQRNDSGYVLMLKRSGERVKVSRARVRSLKERLAC